MAVVGVAALGTACQVPGDSARSLVRAREGRQVAITIDDLPSANFDLFKTPAERYRCVEKLTALLVARRIAVTGFFNMRLHALHPALLPLWQKAGVQLGNHTWAHQHPEKVDLDRYLAELEQGHQAIAALIPPATVIPFRYPFLAEGLRPGDRDRIRRKLRELNSPVAPVTIDTMDWFYARGYQEARNRGDGERAALHKRSWRWNLEEATYAAERWARALFDREPPQVLLLHGNCLNADHLGEYLDWLSARGYTVVPLAKALADPAYAEPDRSTSPTGDSHWLRLWRSRTLSPAGEASR